MYLSPPLLHAAADAMAGTLDRVSVSPQLHVRDPRIEHIGGGRGRARIVRAARAPLRRRPRTRARIASLARVRAVPSAGLHERFSRRRLQRVVEYINDHIAEELSLAQLARVVDMSPRSFASSSSAAPACPRINTSFAAGSNTVEMLARERFPLSDVALQAGFSPQSHMARCMKRLMGVTPATIRS